MDHIDGGEIAPTEDAKPHLLLEAICTLGLTRVEWAAAFALRAPTLGGVRETVVILDRATSEARHHAVREAQRKGADILFFWDDDVIPLHRAHQAKMLAAMAEHPEIDVLGGVYPVRREVTDPIVIAVRDGLPWQGWRDGKLHKVYMVGTAYMAIRMSSFADVPLPWFDDSGPMSDDYSFAEVCAKYGKSIYVDGRAICDQIDLDGTRYSIENGVSRDGVSSVSNLKITHELKGAKKVRRPRLQATVGVNGASSD